jgi:tyrosine-protein phosphatase SIW14
MTSSLIEPTTPAPSSPRRNRGRYLLAIVALAVAAGGYWAFWHHHTKRFQILRKGVFYRVAQPSEFGLWHLVKYHGIKTIVSVQLYDFKLHQGLISFGSPDGRRESQYVKQLGAQPVQWPMGVEKSWPWLTPWQFEQFFELVDDPSHWPVVVHCQGGRHRTGTLSALFRLEYDRWPADRALAEMYSFHFGGAIRLQDHNLRTYLPRPHPNADEWTWLARYWSPLIGGASCADYETLVRRLRQRRRSEPDLDRALSNYVSQQKPFCLPLAQRLIIEPTDPVASNAAKRAAFSLNDRHAGPAAWSMAAAIVADFGTPDEQKDLLTKLGDSKYQRASAERFDALVDGVTNRYTTNRVAYLRPLLDNETYHLREGTRQYRYCDTAVARLSSIVDENFPDLVPGWGIDAWNNGRVAARAWLLSHPAECQLGQLKSPTGQTVVQRGDPPPREDLRKARL